MDFGALAKVGTPKIPVQRDGTIALAFRSTDRFSRCKILDTVCEEIWVAVAKNERPELHHADEAGKVKDLCVGITPVEDTGEIEQFCALIYLSPEALFNIFLGRLQSRLFFDEVQMSENANDLGETVRL